MLKYLRTAERSGTSCSCFPPTEEQVAFQDVLEEATQKVGLKATITLTDMANIEPGWNGKRGMIDAAMIRDVIPDASRRLLLVSSPSGNGQLGQGAASLRGRASLVRPGRTTSPDTFPAKKPAGKRRQGE